MTRLLLLPVAALAAALTLPAPAAAKSPCEGLSGAARAKAEELLATLSPYACCEGTFAQCLAAEAPAKLVRQLADGVCRRATEGEGEDAIKRWLADRKASLVSGPTKTIKAEATHFAGAADAPVEVVVYACARCPYCKMSVVPTYQAVTGGALAGKAKLAYRLFPLKSHEGAVEAALAYEVARTNGKYWDYILHSYQHYEDVSPEALVAWAKIAGLDPAAMKKGMRDAGVRRRVAESKREGIKNGVTGTPTYFIDGREYRGDMSPTELYDAIEEAWARKTGVVCKP